jgi:hypothetical protein
VAGSGDLVRAEIYTLLGITNTADPMIPLDTARQGINRTVALVAKELGLGPAWITSAISLTTALRDYTLPGTVEYEQVLQMIYSTDKQPLRKVPLDEILAARGGSGSSSGRQFAYALTPTSTQTVTVSFAYLPNAAETIDVLATTMPVPWPKGSAAAPTIPFSTTALRSLELLGACDLGGSLGPDKMNALDLNPKTFDGWRATAMELIRQERLTIIRLKRANGPTNYAWFSSWSGN